MQLVGPGIVPFQGLPGCFIDLSFLSVLEPCECQADVLRVHLSGLREARAEHSLPSTQELYQGVGSKLPYLDGDTDVLAESTSCPFLSNL